MVPSSKYLCVGMLLALISTGSAHAAANQPKRCNALVAKTVRTTADKAQVDKIANAIARVVPEDKQARKQAFAVIAPFKAYFEAINQRMFERKNIVDLAEVSLIAEEHLLLMGPPGNAKSQVSDMILGNIVDGNGKPSYFRLQMTAETTLSETHGPMDFKRLNDDGKQVRIYSEGALKSRGVFFDEIFDARANATRNILGLLAERQHAQGPNIEKGDIQTAIGATNKYLSEVYERAGDDGPRAVIDRFAFVVFVPATFEMTDSSVSLITRKKQNQIAIPKFTFEQLKKLNALTDQVEIPISIAKALTLLSVRMKAETEALELASIKSYKEKIKNGEEPSIPYRATKFHSPRTIAKAANILRAYVVRDWVMKNGKRKLEANLDDLKKLHDFFTLNGPTDDFVRAEMNRTSNPHEKAQLLTIIQEREIFSRYMDKIIEEMDSVSVQYAIQDVSSVAFTARTKEDREKVVKSIIGMMAKVETDRRTDLKQSDLDGTDIGRDYVMGYLESLLKNFVSTAEIANLKSTVLNEIARQRQAVLDAEKARVRAIEEARLQAQREAQRREAEARAAEQAAAQRKEKMKIQFTDPSRFTAIDIPVSGDNHGNVKFAVNSSGTKLIFANTNDNSLTTFDISKIDSGAQLRGVTLSGVLTDLGGDEIQSMTLSDQNVATIIQDGGQTAMRVDLTDSSVDSIIINNRNTLTISENKTGNIISFDPRTKKMKVISANGKTTTHELQYADQNVRDQFMNDVESSEIRTLLSDDGKYIVFRSSNNPNAVYSLDLQKWSVNLVLNEILNGEASDPSILANSRNSEVVGVDVSGSQPRIVRMPRNQFEVGNGALLVKGADMFMTDNNGNHGLVMFDAKTGDNMKLQNIFGLEQRWTGQLFNVTKDTYLVLTHDGTYKFKLIKLK